MRAHEVLPAGSWQGSEERGRVLIDFDRRHRRRFALRTEGGEELLLDLPQAARLRDGDGLLLEGGGVVRVVAQPEPLLDIHAHDPADLVASPGTSATATCRCSSPGAHIRIRADHVIEEMVRALGGPISERSRRRSTRKPELMRLCPAGIRTCMMTSTSN